MTTDHRYCPIPHAHTPHAVDRGPWGRGWCGGYGADAGRDQTRLLGTILGAAGGASQAGLSDAEVDAAVERAAAEVSRQEPPCQAPGLHGEPMCVRALDQRPDAGCPDAPAEAPAHVRPTRTDRGFAHMPPITTAREQRVRVYESFAASGPHVWLAVADHATETFAHLSSDDARQLAGQLTYLLQNHYQTPAETPAAPDPHPRTSEPGTAATVDAGPGWDREAIAEAVVVLTSGDRPDLGAEVTRLLADRDRHRHLGPDGQHGDRHTPTCGCDPAGTVDAEPAGEGLSAAEAEQLRQERDAAWEAVGDMAALKEQRDAARAQVEQLRAELAEVTAERDRLHIDVERYRPLWSDPLARPERWVTEPNPHPRRYVSTHEVLEDYDDAIRCASDWSPQQRHAALERTLHNVRPLVYEVEHLREDLDRVSAERDRLREHSITLNTITWDIATALGDVPEGADTIRGRPTERAHRLIAEVEQLRDERDQVAAAAIRVGAAARAAAAAELRAAADEAESRGRTAVATDLLRRRADRLAADGDAAERDQADPSTTYGHEVERAKRGQWAAAWRAAVELFGLEIDYVGWEVRALLAERAAEIEAGELTPWAAGEPAGEQVPDQAKRATEAVVDTQPSSTGDGPILGRALLRRALLDEHGRVWTGGPNWWTWRSLCSHCAGYQAWSREEIAEHVGPVRDALLVTPAAGRLIEAALAWGEARDAWTDDPGQMSATRAYLAAERKLAAAVDALDGDRPAEGGEVRGDG